MTVKAVVTCGTILSKSVMSKDQWHKKSLGDENNTEGMLFISDLYSQSLEQQLSPTAKYFR